MAEPAEPSRMSTRLQNATAPTHSDAVADAGPTRDGEFWLGDGSIVLIAGNTGFRVYRELLAAQSPIFADMFATAAPSTDESIEGCPVVHVSDSAEDMRHFLRALLPKKQRSFFQKNKDMQYTIAQISSLVRLSHKYQVEDLLGQALSALRVYFTDSFAEWDTATDYPFDPPVPAAGIEVIHLAKLTETPSMLPIAMYTCAAGGSAILDGWRREDGTVVHPSREDLGRIIDGYGDLQRRALALNQTILDPFTPSTCQFPTSCRSNMQMMWERLTEEAFLDSRVLHHLRDIMAEYDLCAACLQMLETRDRTERRKLWKSLPAIFGLAIEGWDDVI
ncbi:hypothetical protein C8T65DRAFT_632773 [Cerioporus squamosus]|nr:hypothetical protein C8T65DRAFT_632773 [Cerioporus squamosus]